MTTDPVPRVEASYLHHLKCATATSQSACDAWAALHWAAVVLTSAPRVVMDAQVVKLSLKRTVWGVVTSATASSCPSDKPSSASEEKTDYTYDSVNVSSCRSLTGNDQYGFLLPFRVLQRFGLVRSSMDLTDWNKNHSLMVVYNKMQVLKHNAAFSETVCYLQIQRFILPFQSCGDSWGFHLSGKHSCTIVTWLLLFFPKKHHKMFWEYSQRGVLC